MKGFLFFLLFIGLILIVAGYIQSNQRCPPPVVVYRYIPRTFDEEQDNPLPLMSIFGSMFEQPDEFMKYRGYAMNVPESVETAFERQVVKPIQERTVNQPVLGRPNYAQEATPSG
jgi:hypothetical protein